MTFHYWIKKYGMKIDILINDTVQNSYDFLNILKLINMYQI